ncbi:MAG TPA: DUF4824 family protein [Gemmatimonadales bacterium]|nr:DUF4824 family protein [Gemmatimonadales bacterium]
MRARGWVVVGIVLLATAVALAEALWNRSAVGRETVLTDREAPISGGGRDETARWMRLEYVAPTDSAWGGWLGTARLAALGADTTVDAVRRRQMDARPAFAVLEFDGPAWQDYVVERIAGYERTLVGDSSAMRRDSLLTLFRSGLERDSRLIMVDAGPDAAALAARYPDPARHLILPAVVRTFVEHRFVGPSAPVDTVLGSRVELEHRRLLVSDEQVRVVREPSGAAGYRVTLATGRSHAPWVRKVEPE